MRSAGGVRDFRHRNSASDSRISRRLHGLLNVHLSEADDVAAFANDKDAKFGILRPAIANVPRTIVQPILAASLNPKPH